MDSKNQVVRLRSGIFPFDVSVIDQASIHGFGEPLHLALQRESDHCDQQQDSS